MSFFLYLLSVCMHTYTNTFRIDFDDLFILIKVSKIFIFSKYQKVFCIILFSLKHFCIYFLYLFYLWIDLTVFSIFSSNINSYIYFLVPFCFLIQFYLYCFSFIFFFSYFLWFLFCYSLSNFFIWHFFFLFNNLSVCICKFPS